MRLEDFNSKTRKEAEALLFSCCGSSKWTAAMLDAFPYRSEQEMISKATSTWYEQCSREDWLEAFSHHPRIGDIKSLEEKFADIRQLAGEEQSSMAESSNQTLELFAEGNKSYEKKFGFLFLVSATGKTAAEMLRLLNDRIKNSVEEEIAIAMGEQHKITTLRIRKIMDGASWNWMRRSQLTTHILDTSIGEPGRNITVKLQTQSKQGWQTMAQGLSNHDGRVADLLPDEKLIVAGIYKLAFETGNYFNAKGIKAFYPSVEIQFFIDGAQHYHVPLLLNPFCYSTYRGS
jgi:5-hydroxyisourate hydrolase/2-oxo-4-hydroxy-4-carboxy-5-ureidoimidazoline decarboxylase